MSIMDMNFDDVFDPKTLADGTEVTLRIRSAEIEDTKDKQHKMLTVSLIDPSDIEVSPIVERMVLPNDNDKNIDPVKYNNMKRRLQSFFSCFNLNFSNANPSDEYPGAEGTVILKEEDDETYGKRNTVRKWVTGH